MDRGDPIPDSVGTQEPVLMGSTKEALLLKVGGHLNRLPIKKIGSLDPVMAKFPLSFLRFLVFELKTS